jgi:hypothetical protein
MNIRYYFDSYLHSFFSFIFVSVFNWWINVYLVFIVVESSAYIQAYNYYI